MTLTPTSVYRYSFKEGMIGWDVEALQIALNGSGLAARLTTDGVFGPATAQAVKWIQKTFGITQDGIAGPETQAKICQRACSNGTPSHVPAGLLKGICEGESGYIIPTTSGLYSDGSRDYGTFQVHLRLPGQVRLEEAFNPNKEAVNVAAELRVAYTTFFGRPGAKTAEEAWKLAVLNHNWPAAADQLAAGTDSTWKYTSGGKEYGMADAAPWIASLQVPGVTTGYQWCHFYIEKKIMYVRSWTV